MKARILLILLPCTLIPLILPGIAPDLVLAQPISTADTTLVLGGPDRWDGRFETAAGEPAWHGWTHADLYGPIQASRWHVSGHQPLSGDFSMWCGTWFENDCADGYGDNWRDSLVFERAAADPAAPTLVRWQAIARVDSEPDYDFFQVQVRRGATWQDLLPPVDGTVDLSIDTTFTIEPADYVDGTWQLRFFALSDEAFSDEDCLWDTQGFARVDDIVVSVAGEVISSEDFESGGEGDWQPQVVPVMGDFTALWSGLADLDPAPDRSNDSWQVAFIDDGLVVPGTGGTACITWCYGPDGWAFNVTGGLGDQNVGPGPFGTFNPGVWNAVISPVLDWPEAADAGEIAFDVYAHMQDFECGLTTYGWSLRATDAADPAELEAEVWQPTRWSIDNQDTMPAGPGYARVAMRLDESLPPGTRWIQVRLEAHEAGPWCWGEYVWDPTPAPYFDNVAVRAWPTVTSTPPDVAPLEFAATPNPFNPRVTLHWRQPTAGRVDLAIFDARGRLVRRLLASDRPAGTGEAVWDGRDDGGAGVAAGVYLARMRTSAGAELCKLTLVR
jgi:hypothetical protein